MPDWCPKCHGMLPPGLETCPRCGAKLDEAQEAPAFGPYIYQEPPQPQVSAKDIFYYSAYIIGILLIPLVIGLILALICIFVFNAR
jgi:predicted amidophosphoribosyltransferase